MRVVSLLPSATETLGLLLGSGLDQAGVRVVGRSHECDFPSTAQRLPALTAPRTDYAAHGAAGVDAAVSAALARGESLYTLDRALLERLRPDLIITQDLCEVCSIDLASVHAAAVSMERPPEILSLNPRCLEDVLDDVLRIGQSIGAAPAAESAVASLRERLDAAGAHANAFVESASVLFLEWTDPPFVGGHWTPQLIERAGATHPLNPTRERLARAHAGRPGPGAPGADREPLPGAPKSARVSPDAIVASAPDAVIVCPCGLSLAQARTEVRRLQSLDWFAGLPAARTGQIAVIDGAQMFNRPGPRLVDAFEWLVGWLHGRPEVIPRGFPWARL